MKPTFGQVFAFSLVGLIAILALLFHLVSSSSRETITESSESIRDQASSAIGERIARFLDEAPEAARQFQREVEHGLVITDDPHSIEPALFALLLANNDLAELTLTYGKEEGFDDQGEIKLAAHPRGQWSVIRSAGANAEGRLWSRHVYQEGEFFVADRRELSTKSPSAAAPWIREAGHLPDPTAHPTFMTPASRAFRGRLLPSDLHWSQLDADLPEIQRRVEVSVQQTIADAQGQFVGVLRAGLLTQQLDGIVHESIVANGKDDPQRTFLCDEKGLNKQYGTTIIASEAIVKMCGEDFVFRLLDRVAVKGKSEAIRIYELLGRKGEAGELGEIVAAYENAFAAYGRRDFASSIEILARQPGDGPSARLLERCQEFQKKPPSQDWDGIYVSMMK